MSKWYEDKRNGTLHHVSDAGLMKRLDKSPDFTETDDPTAKKSPAKKSPAKKPKGSDE